MEFDVNPDCIRRFQWGLHNLTNLFKSIYVNSYTHLIFKPNRMATQYDTSRLLNKYRSVIICVAALLFAQAFMALRIYFFHPESDFPTTQQANQEKDHSQHLKKYSHSLMQNEIINLQAQIPVSKTKTSSPSTSLNLELLNFTPECEITIKESISAIQRAKTQKCKEQLAKTACGIQRKSLYPKRLPRFCQNEEYTYRKHLGCYQDEKSTRILNDSFALKKENNSPQNCIDLCLQSGFLYAGVQYSVECFCGNQRPPLSSLLDSSLCYMKCPFIENLDDNEDPYVENSTCGGYFTMDVYETGVFNSDEMKNNVYGLEDISKTNLTNSTVRIVFFLTLNGRALRQVIRLIKALFHERHFFYIHVDSRQDYLFRELLILKHKLPNNIRFMTDRKGSIWGGASLLTVLLSGMKELVFRAEEWNWKWDYVINLSESDFPLKTIEKLEIFLTMNNGKNFVKSHGRDVLKFIQKQGLDKTFDECEFRMWRMGDRVLPAGILMDGGSDWIALHREFVEYLVKDEDELVRGLVKVFKHSLLPAESFFHTVLRNSALCKTFVDNNLHVTNWKRKLGCKCQYRNIVDWCGCSPNDFRLADWSRLQMTESRLIFFGRKFESVVNQGIVNQLEAALNPERHKQNFATLDRYWQSIFHHYDLSPKVDDTLLTLGHSLSRIAMKTFLANYLSSSTKTRTSKNNAEIYVHVVEMNIYVQEDQNRGFLVRFDFDNHNTDKEEQSSVQFEAWFIFQNWIKNNVRSENLSVFRTKILNLRVGTDYDQKEQIFRNFAGSMGPTSEPTLAYTCLADESFNVTFIWINPNHSIQSRQNVSIGIGETANFLKPSFRVQLIPGEWIVKLFDVHGLLIAQTQFLILPRGQNRGATLSRKYKKNEDIDTIENETEIQSTIDNLVSKYYVLQDICIEKEMNLRDISILEINEYKNIENIETDHKSSHMDSIDTTLCSHAQWSSLYPDPKSTIIGIDKTTGLLIP